MAKITVRAVDGLLIFCQLFLEMSDFSKVWNYDFIDGFVWGFFDNFGGG